MKKKSEYRSIVTSSDGRRLTIISTPAYQIFLMYGAIAAFAAILGGDALLHGVSHISKDAVEMSFVFPVLAAVVLYVYDDRGNFVFDREINTVTYKKSGFLKKKEAGHFSMDHIKRVDTQFLQNSPGTPGSYIVIYKLLLELNDGRIVFVRLNGRKPNIIHDLLDLSKFLKMHVSLPWKEPDGTHRII